MYYAGLVMAHLQNQSKKEISLFEVQGCHYLWQHNIDDSICWLLELVSSADK
jgi:hypothetical protein